MLLDEIIAHTKKNFPSSAEDEFHITPLEKGGSGRKFYRIQSPKKDALILVKYTTERQENSRYVDIARFLSQSGVRVPAIFRHDTREGLIWMQDLGESDLWTFRGEPWEIRRPLYEKTLREAARLHCEATANFEKTGIPLEKEFNEELYLWEQNYFFENCLGAIYEIPSEMIRRDIALPQFADIARRLAAEPRVLVHRDFQSQNILVLDGEVFLIDFQGMRPGLAQYDLASLLYDPYVTLRPEERAHLLSHYKSLRGITDASFDEIFHLCALQRLMQALGAYGFLGLQKGKPEFLRHVSPASRNLKTVVANIPGLSPFHDFLETLPEYAVS